MRFGQGRYPASAHRAKPADSASPVKALALEDPACIDGTWHTSLAAVLKTNLLVIFTLSDGQWILGMKKVEFTKGEQTRERILLAATEEFDHGAGGRIDRITAAPANKALIYSYFETRNSSSGLCWNGIWLIFTAPSVLCR
jgi:hypothetical protein